MTVPCYTVKGISRTNSDRALSAHRLTTRAYVDLVPYLILRNINPTGLPPPKWTPSLFIHSKQDAIPIYRWMIWSNAIVTQQP